MREGSSMHGAMMEGIRAAREYQEDEETKRLRLENLRLENRQLKASVEAAEKAAEKK